MSPLHDSYKDKFIEFLVSKYKMTPEIISAKLKGFKSTNIFLSKLKHMFRKAGRTVDKLLKKNSTFFDDFLLIMPKKRGPKPNIPHTIFKPKGSSIKFKPKYSMT